jgi:ATP-dependent helicase/nuclease subunit A
MSDPASGLMGAPMPPDQAQRDRILEALDSNMLVEAAAGTGKTTSMLDRMIALLREGRCESIATMAAVTFTRKAASELRTRFQARLEKEAAEAGGIEGDRLATALADIDQCFIGTIHSFCARLLRERPVEAGVDLAFEEIEPEQDMRLREEAWGEYLASVIARDPDSILGRLGDVGMTLTEIESAFLRFADFPDVDRWPAEPPGTNPPVLEPALAEIKKYIQHMRECEPLPVDDGKPGRLVGEYRRLPGMERRTDPDDRSEVIELISQFDKAPPSMSRDARAANLDFAKAEQAEWKRIREEFAGPVMEEVYRARYALAIEVCAGALEVYDRHRIGQGKLNFQDLLMKSASLLEDKPHVRAYFSRRFTHLLVDEFQDTDPVQAKVMLFLTATDPRQADWRKCVPRPGSLFVVGDPKQSIYRFRRADIVTYNDVRKIIERNGEVVQLSANFRATGELVQWANSAFEQVFPEEATEQSPAFVALEQGRAAGEPGEAVGARLILSDGAQCTDDIDGAIEDEAELIAHTIKDAVTRGMKIARLGGPGQSPEATAAEPGDFMIIAFNKDYLSIYARKLQEHGVPHEVTGGTALNEVWELRLLNLCLRAVTQPDNPVALLGVLRSELFGVSDRSLYAFKQANGRFSYNSEVPGELVDDHAGPIREAFASLKEYSLWLKRMPPVAALELIIADLGLMVLAASRPGGDVQAGSLAKGLELIRGMQAEMPTAAELTGYLGGLVDPDARSDSFDGISALSQRPSAVRIMNLHKAKGLQAPVVFLASPRTRSSDEIDMFIDRSGDVITGYMAIGVRNAFGGTSMRAKPVGWDALKEREKAFQQAEADRLRYVAATRAETMLVVSCRDDGKGKNIWKELAGHIDGDSALTDPGEPAVVEPVLREVSGEDVSAATDAVRGRMGAVRAPTYRVRAAKEYAVSGDYGREAAVLAPAISFAEVTEGASAPVPEGEHGAEWGGAVHQLLELVTKSEGAELETVAAALLEEAGLDVSRAADLLDTVKAVMASDIWRRAGEADRRMSEVPFEVVLETGPDDGGIREVLVRGAIDLAFLEGDGWTLVDYKTDAVPPDGDMSPIAEHYGPQIELYARAFEACTGERVARTALYFVRKDLTFWGQV